jgi:hypothetical protein
MSPGAQNMKTGPDTLGTTENESGSAKHENKTRRPRYRRKQVRMRKSRKQDPTPSVQSITSPGAQIKKTGPDALGTAKNEFEGTQHENGTRRTRYRRK